ncbi:MAG: Shedu immune nuclease family protein [Blastocatellia bacterium]
MLIDWKPKLRERRGSQERLAGVAVFHDFKWSDVFGHDRGQFKNGQDLARLVKKHCPPNLKPALLLTVLDDVQERGFVDDWGYYVVVVKIHQYLQIASGHAAATYFASLLPTDVISAQSLDWTALSSQQFQVLLDKRLDGEQLSTWMNASPERIRLLARLLAKQVDVDLLDIQLNASEDIPWLITQLVDRHPELWQALAEIFTKNQAFLPALVRSGVVQPEALRALLTDQDVVPMLLPLDRSRLLNSLVTEMGDSFWTVLEAAGASIPHLIAERAVAEQRRQALIEFQANINSEEWIEHRWQEFFQTNTWIFGYGLAYHILGLIQEQPEVGGSDLSGSGAVVGDYLYATQGALRFTVLVEIKRPSSELVRDQHYRNRVPKLGEDMVGAVVQTQQQCYQWAIQGSRTEENREILEQQGIYTYEPKGIVVIGNTASLDTVEKRRTFEVYRRNVKNPEVLTFDELLERARFIVGNKDLEFAPGDKAI